MKTFAPTLALGLLLVASSLVLCACSDSSGPAAEAAAPAAKPPEAAPNYTLVFLKTGPADAEVQGDERKQAFQGHFENMGRMANERQLVVAGPFGKNRHDATLRGLFVMNSGEREKAAAWAATDPTTVRGVLVQELHSLSTDAPLLRGLERELEREARDKAEGKTPDMAANMRTYVLLVAEHGDVARRELEPLVAEGRVFLLGALDGTRAIAWLDAKDLAEAEKEFGPVLARLGAHTLDEWFGSNEVARLSKP